MLQGQALEIVLKMARFFPHKNKQDEEAIEEVEILLKSYEMYDEDELKD